MLGFVLTQISLNVIPNLELGESYKALESDLVLRSVMTLTNVSRRDYALTVDATKKQLV